MSGKQSWNLMAIVLGNMLYALTVELFLTPCGLITGGSTGISLFLWRLSGIPASLIALVFNAVLLVVGWLTLGKKFALTTILSTFLFPLFLGLFDRLLKARLSLPVRSSAPSPFTHIGNFVLICSCVLYQQMFHKTIHIVNFLLYLPICIYRYIPVDSYTDLAAITA